MSQVEQIVVHQHVPARNQCVPAAMRLERRVGRADLEMVGNEAWVRQVSFPGPYPNPIPTLDDRIRFDGARFWDRPLTRDSGTRAIRTELDAMISARDVVAGHAALTERKRAVWTAAVKRHGLAGFAAIKGDRLVQN